MREIDPPRALMHASAELEQKARQLLRNSLAPSTLLRHRRRFRVFAGWCESHGRRVLPASTETIQLFLSDVADRYHFNSIKGLLDTLAFAHRTVGEPFDRQAFAALMRGIYRVHGAACRQVAPIMIGELRTIVKGLPDTIAGARDRAVLAVGFAGALRSSELVGLDIGVVGPGGRGLVTIDKEGARITLSRSKTDQMGEGIHKLLPRGGDPCPVRALEEWLAAAGISSGPVFRPFWRWGVPRQQRMGHCGVGNIVKKAVYASALKAGATEAQARMRASQVASHSLRVGFVASAARAKIISEDIATHVGWVGTQMVARYMRQLDPLDDNPAQLVLGT